MRIAYRHIPQKLNKSIKALVRNVIIALFSWRGETKPVGNPVTLDNGHHVENVKESHPYFSRIVFTIGLSILLLNYLHAANFEVINSGDWTDLSIWKQDGGAATRFPGQSTGDAVSINSAYTVNLDVSPGNALTNVNWNFGTLNIYNYTLSLDNLSINSGANVDLGTGQISIANNLSVNGTCNAGSGTINYNGAGAQTIQTNLTYYNLTLSGSNTKTIYSGITINGNLSIEGLVVFNSSGNAINLKGNWTNSSSGGFSEGSGTVTLSGTSTQSISCASGETFYNLVVDYANGITLASGNVTVSNLLTMTSGNLNTGSNTLIISNNATGAISRTSGTVIGKLQRAISTSGTYDFPIGTASFYRPASFTFTSAAAGYLIGEFVESDPGSSGIPYDDDVTVNALFTDGYWHFQNSGFSSSAFNVTLTGNGFSSYSINANTRVSSKSGADWGNEGTHGSVSGNQITRNNMTNFDGAYTDFAFGGPCPRMDLAVSDQTICDGDAATITLTGSQNNVSYQLRDGINPIGSPQAGTGGNLDFSFTPTVTKTYNILATSGGCPVELTDKSTVTLDNQTANAGTDQEFCDALTTTLNGNTPSAGTGTWSQVSGPGTLTFDDTHASGATASADIFGAYILRWTIVNGNCTQSDEVTVDFNEDPDGLSAGNDVNLCGLLSMQLQGTGHSYQAGSEHNGSTKTWTYVSGPDNTPTFSDPTSPTSTVDVDLYGSYVFRWTETNGNCTQSDEVTINFGEIPKLILPFVSDTICSNETTNIPISSTVPGSGYSWIVEYGNHLGAVDGFGDVINQTLINPSNKYDSVIYRIIPEGPLPTQCIGMPDTIVVYIEPVARLTASPKRDTICNGDQVNITLTSPTVPTREVRYRYTTEANAGVTVTPNSANGLVRNTTLTNTITNNTDTAQLVKFIITPYIRVAGSETEKCTGINDTAYIWVEPTAKVLATPQQDTICNGSAVSIRLSSPTGPTREVRYRYTTEANAGVTVTPNSAGGLVRNTTLANTITNSTDTAQLVKFIITPYTRVAGSETEKCTGTNDTAYIWVEPTAKVLATPQQDTICNGSAVSIRLSSSTGPTREVRYRYTTEANAGVTVTPNSAGGLVRNTTLTNTIANSTDTAQLVKFIITPYTRVAGSETEKCTGTNDTAYIWVEPTAKVLATPQQDTICNDAAVSIRLSSPTGPTREVRYRYTTEANAGVTVTPNSANGLVRNTTLTNTITNNTDTAQLVKFIITPYTRQAGSEIEKCTGINDTAYIWVEPTAKVLATPQQDTICNGSAASIRLSSPTGPTREVRYRYTTEANAGVTVTPNSAGGLVRNTTLTNTITNSTDTAQLVKFIITPYTRVAGSETEKCTGTNDTAYIWVEPTAKVLATPQQDTICNGAAVSIRLGSPTGPTREVRYRYTTEANAGVTVTPNSAGGLVRNATLTNTITNSTDTAQLVKFIITPYSRQAGSETEKCTGINDTAYIWVEPTARTTVAPKQDTICNGDQVSIRLLSSTGPTHPVRFRYVTQAPYGVIVNPATGNGLDNNDILTNTIINNTDTAKLVKFIVTPYTTKTWSGLERCAGIIDTAYVWVEPTTKVHATPEVDTICTGLSTNIKLESPSRPTNPVKLRYQSIVPPGVTVNIGTGTNLSNGYTITDTITNFTSIPQKVTFIITPYTCRTCDGDEKCTGIPFTVSVWVAPKLMIQIDTLSTYHGGVNIRCNGEKNGMITLDPEGGITAFSGYDDYDLKYSWSNGRNTLSISGLAAGNYSVIVKDKLQCRDSSMIILSQPNKLSVDYTVIDTLSCHGHDGTIAAVTSGGITNYSYSWTPPIDYELDPPIVLDTLYNIIDGAYKIEVTDANGCYTYKSFTVEPPAAASISAISDTLFGTYQIKCFGDNSGKLASINTSMQLVKYHWTGPGMDTTFTNTAQVNFLRNLYAGKYLLTYTDASGCNGAFVLNLKSPDQMVIPQKTISRNTDGYNVTCYGSSDGSITLNTITGGRTGTYVYNWEAISGGSIVNPVSRDQSGLQAGTYVVVISDAFGCFVSDTSMLVQPPMISIDKEVSTSISGGYNLNCFGDKTGYIMVQASGGSGAPYTYLWNGGYGTATQLNNLSAGEYIITVDDSKGCHNTDTIFMTQPAKFQIESAGLSNYNGYGIQCSGDSNGVIDLRLSGGVMKYQYNWTINGVALGQDTGYLNNLHAGIYHALIMDGNNCEIKWDATLNEPDPLSILLDIRNINCTGTVLGSVTAQPSGGISPYGYQWNNGETSSTISNLANGEYILNLQDKNSCITVDTATIIQNTEVDIAIQVVNAITCNGLSDGVLQAVPQGGVAPYNYQWNGGPATQNYGHLAEGDYSVTVVDYDGCIGNQSINLNDPDPLKAIFTVIDPTCYGKTNGSVSLNAQGGSGTYRYQWLNIPIDGDEVNNLHAGSYSLNVTDAKNCEADTTVIVEQPEKLLIHVDERYTVYPFCPDWQNGALAVRVKGGTRDYQYIWTDYSEENDSILSDIKEDFYTVRVIDAQECVTDTVFRLKAQHNTCLGIPSAYTPNGDHENDYWDISYITEDGGEAKFHEVYPNGVIHVYDRIGNLVFHCSGGCPEEWNGQDLQGRDLPVDTYYYVIELNTGEKGPLKGIVTIIR